MITYKELSAKILSESLRDIDFLTTTVRVINDILNTARRIGIDDKSKMELNRLIDVLQKNKNRL